MEPLPLSRIADFARARITAGDPRLTVSRLSTDSRTIQPGEFFVPIRGVTFDGHRFVEQVAAQRAAGALVEEGWEGKVPKDFALLRVADTLVGYQQIAAGYRRCLPLKVVAITGSNGKTSTKDFVSTTTSVCRARFWKPTRMTKSRCGNSA
jgi:UDP-N-acetylmuramoyl-tripeptide--D-alanyl-D-alanine ligase